MADLVEASLSAALSSGLTLASFYGLTPYLTRLHVEAACKARLVLAWNVEALARTDKLPSLDTLLADQDDTTGLADADEMRAWLAGPTTLQ